MSEYYIFECRSVK